VGLNLRSGQNILENKSLPIRGRSIRGPLKKIVRLLDLQQQCINAPDYHCHIQSLIPVPKVISSALLE
jgi:hypothetical protein